MLDWMLTAWPEDENGEPEEEALLGNENDLASGTGVCCSFLDSCGIPYITRVPSGGEIGALYAGVSPVGRDIYVPASFLEDARELLYGDDIFEFYDDKEETP